MINVIENAVTNMSPDPFRNLLWAVQMQAYCDVYVPSQLKMETTDTDRKVVFEDAQEYIEDLSWCNSASMKVNDRIINFLQSKQRSKMDAKT
jgi:hypothetical protein